MPVFKIIEDQIFSEFSKDVRLKTIRAAAAIFPSLLYSKWMKYVFCEKWIIMAQKVAMETRTVIAAPIIS